MESSPKTKDRGWLLAAAVLSLPVLLYPMANPDIFWHLQAAKMIVSSGALPQSDFFSFSLLGTPWVNFEWLIQLIYYGFHQAAGVETQVEN